MHSDAVAARSHHRGDVLKRQEGHSFEHLRDCGILVHAVNGRVEELRASRNKITCAVAFFLRSAFYRTVVIVMIAVIIFNETVNTEEIQRLFELLRAEAGFVHFIEFLICVPFALFH